MRDVILVNSHNLSQAQISPFFYSLITSQFNGVVALISDMPVELDDNCHFQVWNYPHKRSAFFRSSNRLFLYNEVLQQIGYRFDRVMLTGIRDVIFQKPLQDMEYGYVDLYYEDATPTSGMTLDTCPYNTMWIQRVYGDDMLAMLRGKSTICAEIVTGSMSGVQRLVRDLLCEAEKLEPKEHIEDQAMINVMYNTGRLPYATAHDNDYAGVYTVGNTNPITVSKRKIIRKVNGEWDIPTVIHQYDRHMLVL